MRRRASGTGWTTFLILLLAAAGVLLLLMGREPAQGPAALTPSASVSPSSLSMTPVPTVPPPTPTPSPLLHAVQPGETLAGIAAAYGVSLAELIAVNHIQDPNLIRVGQVLVIPGAVAVSPPTPMTPPASPQPGGPSPTPLPRPILPTFTPSGPPKVEIASVLGAGDVSREMVRLRNQGGMVSLEGWTLSDASGDRFVFPRLILFPGGEVTVYSGVGVSDPTHLYWNRTSPAWQSGELLTLRDQRGEVADTYVVP